MAQNAAIHRFEISLADGDRGVYADLDLRVARHPSESGVFLAARILAYNLEYADGIQFSKGGVSDVDEPALSIFDLRGDRQAWIEVGAPSAARLHRASKATPRVALYTDRRIDILRTSVAGERIHRSEHLLVTAFARDFLRGIEGTLERNNRWSVSIADGHLYLTLPALTLDTAIEPVPLVPAAG